MKFGKHMLCTMKKEWVEYYVDYKFLKSFLKAKASSFSQARSSSSINSRRKAVKGKNTTLGTNKKLHVIRENELDLTGINALEVSEVASQGSTASDSKESSKSMSLSTSSGSLSRNSSRRKMKKISSFSKASINTEGLEKLSFQEVILMELNKTVEFGTRQKLLIFDGLKNLSYEKEKLELWQKSGFPDLETEFSELQNKYICLGREIVEILDFIELNVVAIKKCLKKWDKLIGQHAGLSLLARFEKTHLNSFLDIKELRSSFTEIAEGIQQCELMIDEVRNPNRLKLMSHQNRHKFGMSRSISTAPYRR